jgi:cytochrome c oxidase assembly protein subunit 15
MTRVAWPSWTGRATVLRWLALASVVANVVIVITGGAVRLTNSGLGCPTWPSCTDASLTPTKAYSFHGIIEFTNRQLTFLLVIIAIATFFIAWHQHRQTRLALIAVLSIPAQAVLGGLTVLTHLNPWLVGGHFLFSMAIIAVTMLLWWRLSDHPVLVEAGASARNLRIYGLALVAVTAAVLALGTVVTGAGPHAGDTTNGKVHRNGLHVGSMSQLHADSVMLLIGLTVGLVLLVRVQKLPGYIERAAWWLLGIELAQGVIGFVQYFTHVPALLVAVHMFGACLVWLAALRVLLALSTRALRDEAVSSEQLTDRVDQHAHH